MLELQFNMPVRPGRTRGKNLAAFLGGFTLQDTIPLALHAKLMGLLRKFLVTGGMPESLNIYLKSNSWQECEAVKHTLQTTFENDFNKYGGRIKHQRLQLVFRKIPLLVGNKFKHVNVDRNARFTGKARGAFWEESISFDVA